jgi:hypothetical protein
MQAFGYFYRTLDRYVAACHRRSKEKEVDGKFSVPFATKDRGRVMQERYMPLTANKLMFNVVEGIG